MSTPETDPVGTVREGFREGTVLVKASPGFWMEMGGPKSGCHTLPSCSVLADRHPLIGAVPGTPAATAAQLFTAAASVAADRFAGRSM